MPISRPDAVGDTLHAALDAISLQQRVIANNVANIDTPNFRASRVQFTDALAAAVSDGEFTRGDGEFTPTVTASPTPVGPNGNNVDLQTETMAAMQAQFQYQILTRAETDRNTRMTAVAN